MSYTTTPPSEPGLYQIQFHFDGSHLAAMKAAAKKFGFNPHHIQLDDSHLTAGRLFPDGRWNVLNFGSAMRASEVVSMGGKFGPKIEPPRDDDEELATVEWLREMGIPGSPQPGLSFLELSCVIHLEYTDNTGTTVTLCWETPTKSKARQIMEALR